MIPRFDLPPEPHRRYVFRPGAYAVLLRGRDILLTRQNGSDRALQLPGGGIDPGETPLRALHREVFEETGWRMAVDRRLGSFRRFAFMPEYGIHAEKLCHIFLGRPGLRIGPPVEPDHDAVWMDADEAVTRLDNAGDAYFLARFLRSGRGAVDHRH
ncbi:8-oxo-dGTP diphosphatase [Palleronia salina]|uniref:8-oxo-dGTP diphosphatase n=1 Tax=Palleronia salina TaxID=313368 RepID=A0A1M6CSG1_9RHOB|nr:NUDIX hydrolase [Palleronia salina]SHI63926.1 8-oxo-dGTP diphosphatase [Palleronia salina]